MKPVYRDKSSVKRILSIFILAGLGIIIIVLLSSGLSIGFRIIICLIFIGWLFAASTTSTRAQTICEGMSTSEVFEILGKPHRKATLGGFLNDFKSAGGSVVGLSANSPRLKDEYWLYIFDEFKYEISIRDGKVSKVRMIEKKEASNNYPPPSN